LVVIVLGISVVGLCHLRLDPTPATDKAENIQQIVHTHLTWTLGLRDADSGS
jgi:hypothetical protein